MDTNVRNYSVEKAPATMVLIQDGKPLGGWKFKNAMIGLSDDFELMFDLSDSIRENETETDDVRFRVRMANELLEGVLNRFIENGIMDVTLVNGTPRIAFTGTIQADA